MPRFRYLIAKKELHEPRTPNTSAESGRTKPAAGVTHTSPTTAPVMAPSGVALWVIASRASHVSIPIAAATLVLTVASAATPSLAFSADPPLKPFLQMPAVPHARTHAR
jgi:hypothetical protein